MDSVVASGASTAVPVGFSVNVEALAGTSVTEPGCPGTGTSVRDAVPPGPMPAVLERVERLVLEEIVPPGVPAPGAVELRPPEAVGFLVAAVPWPGLVLAGAGAETAAGTLAAMAPGTA